MTPLERLQAAIEKLEALRAAASPGPWEALYRTIDAQLVILSDALVRVHNAHLIDLAIVESVVALADAILGADS